MTNSSYSRGTQQLMGQLGFLKWSDVENRMNRPSWVSLGLAWATQSQRWKCYDSRSESSHMNPCCDRLMHFGRHRPTNAKMSLKELLTSAHTILYLYLLPSLVLPLNQWHYYAFCLTAQATSAALINSAISHNIRCVCVMSNTVPHSFKGLLLWGNADEEIMQADKSGPWGAQTAFFVWVWELRSACSDWSSPMMARGCEEEQ